MELRELMVSKVGFSWSFFFEMQFVLSGVAPTIFSD